jgi:hypothetical protein
MMRNSSVISSREAVSGSLCKASSTACLSVMSPYYGIPRRGASASKQKKQKSFLAWSGMDYVAFRAPTLTCFDVRSKRRPLL